MSPARIRPTALLCLALLVSLSLADEARAFYSFLDDFSDGRYADKWTITVTGTAKVSEANGLLDVSMTSGGSCSTVVARSTTPVLLTGGIIAKAVLRAEAGVSAGMMLKKDDNNFVIVAVGPENVIIGNKEYGQYAEQVVGSSASHTDRDTEVEFWSCQFGQLFVKVDNVFAGEVTNLSLDMGEMSLELINSYCAAAPSTRHVYYDSVSAGEMFCYLPGRFTGRVTDQETGLGIPFAQLTTDTGGGGVTSPNGYYIASGGDAATLTVTVSAGGYSPQRAVVDVPLAAVTTRDWALYTACPSSVSQGGVIFGAAGGKGSLMITMTQQPGCGTNWLAVGDAAWFALTSPDFGTGDGSLTFSVQAGTDLNWRNGSIEAAGHVVRIAQEGSLRAAVPSAAAAWTYAPPVLPVFDADPGQAQPFAAGGLSAGEVDMEVGLPGFTGPVDIYLGFKMPDALSREIWIILPDLSAVPATTLVAPWRTAVTGPVYDGLYGKFPLSSLPPGRYDLYTLVTPTRRLDSYYFWTTHFEAP